jgi:hypothetical protein
MPDQLGVHSLEPPLVHKGITSQRFYIAVTSEDWHRVTEWLAPKPGAGFRHQAPGKNYRKTP